mmetsp:Transcript_56850/g.120876  ORF Transcript_56850/g.120876 Transcript_56850/m.120876 type:complete len:105 (-) Transcript_56850:123-437(-)|eukprot:CAMPEP_0206489536 /NCGR_PEP_ID=MMETSP0324_2-20121206/43325_1 /ASSEMBLY_ACC=CAM_ASM_000836 /TAXON_ID=2866 /ORGANISM="Crypthecodinium cohnii, Strain Seligo" /LENGTH=104 /DNA_ID=CAMNT_0053969287 /DNA_START=75 /DNA_END=389 /DNA_ORIENTATION=-
MPKEATADYKTLKRLQKNYLVRCGEPLETVIPGPGVKPGSLIKRIETELKRLRGRLGMLAEEVIASMEPNHRKVGPDSDIAKARAETMEKIKELERRLIELEVL